MFRNTNLEPAKKKGRREILWKYFAAHVDIITKSDKKRFPNLIKLLVTTHFCSGVFGLNEKCKITSRCSFLLIYIQIFLCAIANRTLVNKNDFSFYWSGSTGWMKFDISFFIQIKSIMESFDGDSKKYEHFRDVKSEVVMVEQGQWEENFKILWKFLHNLSYFQKFLTHFSFFLKFHVKFKVSIRPFCIQLFAL